MDANTIRIILIVIGAVLISLLYWWERQRSKDKDADDDDEHWEDNDRREDGDERSDDVANPMRPTVYAPAKRNPHPTNQMLMIVLHRLLAFSRLKRNLISAVNLINGLRQLNPLLNPLRRQNLLQQNSC
ncbi:hypothetical protein [Chromatium okenii]|uniref:Cell division protein ZipA n=1 Tax=Chromatium okenii TaxID=61644 RepID=A0A2S7XTC0_9GAMM|nr:hypothetical protein [Chromatium okenii]PQJ96886.1 hypothetical protein CXB77_05220 [Chromatium okenii]